MKKQLLTLFSDDDLEERWTAIIESGQFHPVLARNSLKVDSAYLETINPTSIEDILKSKGVSLGTLEKYRGRVFAEAILVKIMQKYLVMVDGKMSKESMISTARLILEDYDWLYVADFKYLIKSGVKGLFGPIYRMDGNTIFEWIKNYVERRFDRSLTMRSQEHEKIKSEEKKFTPESYQRLVR